MNEGKKVMVESMFDSIAWRYDFLNHFLSFCIDRIWRKKAANIIAKNFRNPVIIDVATGTADLAIASIKAGASKVTGIDISAGMLEIGRSKITKRNLGNIIDLMQADSENIPFENDTFDVAMVAFGVRNFSDPLKGLKEMARVIRGRGMVLVLEFSKPSLFPISTLYNFYFRRILPFVGKLFSKDRAAYSYLPDSVYEFPDNEEFLNMMERVGLTNTRQMKLTGGIASIYTAFKDQIQ
jgi:demethylmenaquinone methyltransferase/2-methoxy-6-polyprenyl-1,4-benzoquinol methylase